MNLELLMKTLADGECHSGQALAETFGVTRAAVWKQAAKLEQWGLHVDGVPGIGYRLAAPLDLLDRDGLRAALVPPAARNVERLDVFTDLDSTNRYLLDCPRPKPGALAVCMAEYQRAGRGRRGRSWNAPLAAGLCLSAGWHFVETPPDLPALTLAVGIIARRAIARLTGIDIELKWPNDLVWGGRKLGGILVELVAEAQGGCYVVAGLGINVAMPRELLETLSDWPGGAVDLMQATGGSAPRRVALAAALIEALVELFDSYPSTGFADYAREFASADHLEGKGVSIEEGRRTWIGTARGIAPDGALLVDTLDGTRRRVISGDITVRSHTA